MNNNEMPGWLNGLIAWVNEVSRVLSDPFTDWREGTAEWFVVSGENFGKWLGDTVAIVARDPQRVAIVLAIIVGMLVLAVVVLPKLFRKPTKGNLEDEADDGLPESPTETLADRLFAVDDPQGEIRH